MINYVVFVPPQIRPTFGNLYYIPARYSKGMKGHWAAVLGVDTNNKRIYYQNLGSGIYKVFPNFGTFTNVYCPTCSTSKYTSSFLKYKLGQARKLSVDEVVFLDYEKYRSQYPKMHLNRDTFLSLKDVEVDILYDFEQRVLKGEYKSVGRLLKHNCQTALIAVRHSSKIDRYKQQVALSSFQAAGY